jgi:glycosyltransferase involved in cell wall biosynthesis
MMIGPFPRAIDRIDGGVAAAVTYLSQALVARPGIELIGVRLATGGLPPVESTKLGWHVEDLPLDRMSVSTLYLKQRYRFRELLRRFRPDVVHGQGVDLAGLLAVDSGRPAIITVHGILERCAQQQTNPIVRARARFSAWLTERPTIRRATDMIAISPYVSGYYRGEIRGRVHDIPNPVSPAFFQLERRPERGRFLYAGRIARGKGVLDLVHAVSRCESRIQRLVLAGASSDPAFDAVLRHAIRELGLDSLVELVGLLDEPALLDEFARAEALILPSYQETAPMVVQQAMAAGLAVVATDVGGIPHQIEQEVTGLLFRPGDVARLADLLTRFDVDPTLGPRLGRGGKSVATARYQSTAVAAATQGVYEERAHR